MRILQLSDPHLMAAELATMRDKPPLERFTQALAVAAGQKPDLLLITGDLCQDETWGGYVQVRSALSASVSCPVALVPGNHDHPVLLNAVLGRSCTTAPAELTLGGVTVLLLSSHWSGSCSGQLGSAQLAWLDQRLQVAKRTMHPLVVAMHHPPIAIGHAALDAMSLIDGEELAAQLRPIPSLKAVVFGHIHQHWRGHWLDRPDVALLGCPSTLIGFNNVQPCPLGRADDPGGRLMEVDSTGRFHHRLLRWTNSGPINLVVAGSREKP